MRELTAYVKLTMLLYTRFLQVFEHDGKTKKT